MGNLFCRLLNIFFFILSRIYFYVSYIPDTPEYTFMYHIFQIPPRKHYCSTYAILNCLSYHTSSNMELLSEPERTWHLWQGKYRASILNTWHSGFSKVFWFWKPHTVTYIAKVPQWQKMKGLLILVNSIAEILIFSS